MSDEFLERLVNTCAALVIVVAGLALSIVLLAGAVSAVRASYLYVTAGAVFK